MRTIDRKLTLNLIVIFKTFTDISFLKYVTKIFCISYYFQEKIGSVLRCSSHWLCLCTFYQVKELISCKYSYIKTLRNIQGNFSTEAALLKCIPSNFFLEICTRFRTTCKKYPLENYILAYHRADRDHAEIF